MREIEAMIYLIKKGLYWKSVIIHIRVCCKVLIYILPIANTRVFSSISVLHCLPLSFYWIVDITLLLLECTITARG